MSAENTHASIFIFSFTPDIYFHGQNSSKYLSARLALSTYSYQDANRQGCDHATNSEAGAEQKQNKTTLLMLYSDVKCTVTTKISNQLQRFIWEM